jgi:chorismate synthase
LKLCIKVLCNNYITMAQQQPDSKTQQQPQQLQCPNPPAAPEREVLQRTLQQAHAASGGDFKAFAKNVGAALGHPNPDALVAEASNMEADRERVAAGQLSYSELRMRYG